MSTRKRTAEEQGSNLEADGSRRASKRFKVLPATGGLLAKLVARLLEDIEEIPPSLVIEGLAQALQDAMKESLLASRDIYKATLHAIDAQITALTEAAQVEANDALLMKRVVIKLQKLKDLLPAAHEAAIDLILIPPEQAVLSAIPHIYSSMISGDGPSPDIPISFSFGNNTEYCLVKVVHGRYGTKVHRLLALDGLAPRLVAMETKEGAHTAIAMEYLAPYFPGSEGWATVFAFAKNIVEPDARKSLARAVHDIVGKLEQANLVHGDLRANNLMVHVNADGTVLDGEKVRAKAIDFDWSGESGKVTYARWRNNEIWWPAGTSEDIVVGHDRALVEHWWETTFPEQAFPPVG